MSLQQLNLSWPPEQDWPPAIHLLGMPMLAWAAMLAASAGSTSILRLVLTWGTPTAVGEVYAEAHVRAYIHAICFAIFHARLSLPYLSSRVF